jgi:hypothetical protein
MEHTTCQTVFVSACTRCHENSTGRTPAWQKPLFLGLGTRVRDCAGNSRHPCIARTGWSAQHHGACATLVRPDVPLRLPGIQLHARNVPPSLNWLANSAARNLPLAAHPCVGHIGLNGAVAEWLKAAVC